jgi:hypothetical protein
MLGEIKSPNMPKNAVSAHFPLYMYIVYWLYDMLYPKLRSSNWQ